MIGLGRVGAIEAILGVRAEFSGIEGRDAKSSGSKVGGDDIVLEGDGAGPAVNAGCGALFATVSTQLATLEVK